MGNNKALVYFFHAFLCKSCPSMERIFKQVAQQYANNMSFRDIDVETEEGVDLTTKHQVRNVPTILVIKNGRVVERIAGTRTKEQLIETLSKWK